VTERDATVSVVDDDPSVRRGLERLLRAAGYQVETYASAEQFIDRADFDGPGCLVLDVRMPGKGGLDVQQFLLDRGALLPIIFITGHGDVPTVVRAMKGGAVDFLLKPFDDEDLLAAVHQALTGKRRPPPA
jgi:FixJ family two-component response regulator